MSPLREKVSPTVSTVQLFQLWEMLSALLGTKIKVEAMESQRGWKRDSDSLSTVVAQLSGRRCWECGPPIILIAWPLRAPPRHSVRAPCPPGVLIRRAPEMDDSKAQYENRLCEEGWRTACANIVRVNTHKSVSALCLPRNMITNRGFLHSEDLKHEGKLKTNIDLRHFSPKRANDQVL